MNILTRTKPPFSAIKAMPVAPKPDMSAIADDPLAAMREQARQDMKAFKFGVRGSSKAKRRGGPRVVISPTKDAVEKALREHGPATLRELSAVLPDIKASQVSTTLSYLKKLGHAVILEDRNQREDKAALWGAV